MNEINDLELGFHNRDGWFFRRDSENGNVRIWKVHYEKAFWSCTENCPPLRQHKPECPAAAESHFVPVLDAGPHVIPENEWASIVASVSKNGESAESWQFVRDFHAGRLAAVEGAPTAAPRREPEA